MIIGNPALDADEPTTVVDEPKVVTVKDEPTVTDVPIEEVQSLVSDYVDGKTCLICDIEFQLPSIAIKHAKMNHLDIIDGLSTDKLPSSKSKSHENQAVDNDTKVILDKPTVIVNHPKVSYHY